ncbi:MAG: cell division protein FtsQ/DivIB [Chitinophagaceae bacterium]
MAAKISIRKIFVFIFWIGLSGGLIAVLVSAIEFKNAKKCQSIDISIERTTEGMQFVNKDDVKKQLALVSQDIVGKEYKDFNIRQMEYSVERIPWVNKAELYFDNDEVLHVNVQERDAIARIFTETGASYYVDSSLHKMPLNDHFTPRLPVITGFPEGHYSLKADTILLQQAMDIVKFLRKDSFWMSQIEQIDVNGDGEFRMVPKVGDHSILFGEGVDIEKKFNKLKMFYLKVLSKVGWSKYSQLDLSFNGQLVAVKKDQEMISNLNTNDTLTQFDKH